MTTSRLTFWSGYIVLIAIFYYLYFPHSPPLTKKEIESSIFCKRESDPSTHKSSNEHWQFCDAFLSKPDTGKEFYAINFIKKRTSTEGLYPADFEPEQGCADSPQNAEICYVKRFLPFAFKRFSFPFFVASIDKIPFLVSKSLDIKYGSDNFEFDQFSVMRYRSRRDLINIAKDAYESKMDIAIYKEASVETHINYFVDADQIPIITFILTLCWSSIIYILYSIVFSTISFLCCK